MDFDTLFQKIEPAIRFMARKYWYGYRLNYGWEDLYQEICLYLWDKFKSGVPEGINKAYIIRGCEFFTLNYTRKLRDKVRVVSLEEPINDNGNTLKEVLPLPGGNGKESIDRVLAVKDITSRLVNERESQVVSCLSQGYTTRETGRRMGISHVGVIKIKKRIARYWRENN